MLYFNLYLDVTRNPDRLIRGTICQLEWNGTPVSKNAKGYYFPIATEIENVETLTFIDSDLREHLCFIEGQGECFRVYEDQREPGIYLRQGTRLVVFNKTFIGHQNVSFSGQHFESVVDTLIQLREGNIVPTYPLSRPQNAPSYEQMLTTANNQKLALDRLTEQAQTALKVLNAAQETILKQGNEIAELRRLVAKANQKMT